MIESALVERLRRVRLIARRRFRGAGSGDRASAETGGRTEFSGHRGYGPGEDYRDIDWNLAARHDQLFVREYRREEGVPVRVVLDASASMSDKFDFARRVAAAIGAVAVHRRQIVEVWRACGDRVDSCRRFSGAAAVADLFGHLAGFSAGGAMELGEAIRDARARSPRSALTYWLTDGYGGEATNREVAALARRSDDPVVLLVSAPEEIDPPWEGNLRLEDAETGEALEVALGPAEREAYRAAYVRFVEAWRTRCLSSGIRFAWLRSDLPLEDVFFDVLARARIVG